jgi:hypothetical protein
MTALADALLVIFLSSHFRPLRVLIFLSRPRSPQQHRQHNNIEDPAKGRPISPSFETKGDANQEHSWWRCEPKILWSTA